MPNLLMQAGGNQMGSMGSPPVAPIAPQARRPVAPREMIAMMETQHAQSRAQLDKLEELASTARATREQFSHLMNLGDLVTPDDVVASASKIVAAGGEPMNIAGVLADMPPQSEALKAWIAGQAQQFAQKEAQFTSVLSQVRHATGLAALRLLAADSFADQGLGPDAQPLPGSLAPQGPNLAAPNMGIDAGAPSLSPGPMNALMGDFDAA